MTDLSKLDESAKVLPPAPRDDMVNKAIDFLLNPKVQQSPLAQRKAFLIKKGLTVEEVDIAVSRSGVTESVAISTSPINPTQQIVPYQQGSVSKWSRWRDFASTAVLVGGISYALYHFIRKYILPIWLGPSKEERQMAALEMSINQLQRSVEELVASMKTVQSSIDSQTENVKQVALDAAQNRGSTELYKMQDTNSIAELKQELVSLKGLLLSRKQFPPTPITQPIIPAWQLPSRTEAKQSDSNTEAGLAEGAQSDSQLNNSSDSDGENKLSPKASSFVMVDTSEKNLEDDVEHKVAEDNQVTLSRSFEGHTEVQEAKDEIMAKKGQSVPSIKNENLTLTE